jgi:hypothetical protein
MVFTILAYTILMYFIGWIAEFSIKIEFFIAMIIVFFYFLSAIWVLKLSLNKKDPLFLKIYFGGMGLRILLTVIGFVFLIRLGFNILTILLFMIPIYFILLLIEVIEINKVAKQMESSV